MKANDDTKSGFLLTHQSIAAALRSGLRRHLCVDCKGLELSFFLRKFDRPQFYYYWKDRTGAKPKDRREWLGEYDKNSPYCLQRVRKLWEQADALRKAGLPVVLEFPEPPPEREVAEKPKRRVGLTLAQVVPDYCDYLKRSIDLKELSAKTAKPWVFIIRRFWQAMPGATLASLDAAALDAYLESLVLDAQSKGADGQSTRQNTRACLIHFFDWAVTKQLVRENVAKETSRAKYRVSHVKLPDEDLSRYLVALREMRKSADRLAVTHYLWLLTLTGCRRDELSTATIGDFYLTERQRVIVATKAKDRKTHYTGLSHLAVRVVQEQIRLLKSKNLPTSKDSLLFPAASALKKIQRWHGDGLKPMSSHVIYKHHAQVIAKAGIASFTIHDFRRIFATMAAQVGVGPDYQRLLISHTTGRREAHGVYNLHNYMHELKEAASRLAVVFDFLSAEVGANGMRSPLECRLDFIESFEYWMSEPGRRFYNASPMNFYVVGLVEEAIAEVSKRDFESGLIAAIEAGKQRVRAARSKPRAKVKTLGHKLAGAAAGAVTADAEVLPFKHLHGESESAV